MFFTTRCIDGLRDDVRAVVAIQRPSNLDIACPLALLQDEMGDSTRRQDFHKLDFDSLRSSIPRVFFHYQLLLTNLQLLLTTTVQFLLANLSKR